MQHHQDKGLRNVLGFLLEESQDESMRAKKKNKKENVRSSYGEII